MQNAETKAALLAQLQHIVKDANDAIFHLESGNPIEDVIAKAESCGIRQLHALTLVGELKVNTMKQIGENLMKKEAVS